MIKVLFSLVMVLMATGVSAQGSGDCGGAFPTLSGACPSDAAKPEAPVLVVKRAGRSVDVFSPVEMRQGQTLEPRAMFEKAKEYCRTIDSITAKRKTMAPAFVETAQGNVHGILAQYECIK